MADKGKKALSGAATGAAAGSAAGPWGALIGGVAGGIGGLLQGDDPSIPSPIEAREPYMPGGTSGPFGGAYFDPNTRSTQFSEYDFDPSQMGQGLTNQMLYNLLMGQGNEGMLGDLDFQAKSLMQQIQRLQDQQSGASAIGKQQTLAQLLDPSTASNFLDEKGNPINLADHAALAANPRLWSEFQRLTGGQYGRSKAGGGLLGGITSAISKGTLPGESGSYKDPGDNFSRWINDIIKQQGTEAKIKTAQQTIETNKGNADQRDQALKALQNKLDYITQTKERVTGGLGEGNPLLDYLDRRQGSGPTEKRDYTNPWTAKTDEEAEYYRNKARQGLDPAFWVSEEGIPDAEALQAEIEAVLTGAGGNGLGGERMAGIGDYDGSQAGNFVNALNRTAGRSMASNRRFGEDTLARRGLLGGSAGEAERLADELGFEDVRAANLARGYEMDQADRQRWFERRFAVDQHNSEVARLGAQGDVEKARMLASAKQGGFQNKMSIKDLLARIKQQNFGNTQQAQGQNFDDFMAMLQQNTALGQNTINNERYDERYENDLDRQDFSDRMALLNMVTGQQQRATDNRFQGAAVTNQQAWMGNQNSQWFGNANNSRDASNAALQNQFNMGGFQQAMNQSAQDQNTLEQGMLGIGYGMGDYWSRKRQPPPAYQPAMPQQNPNPLPVVDPPRRVPPVPTYP